MTRAVTVSRRDLALARRAGRHRGLELYLAKLLTERLLLQQHEIEDNARRLPGARFHGAPIVEVQVGVPAMIAYMQPRRGFATGVTTWLTARVVYALIQVHQRQRLLESSATLSTGADTRNVYPTPWLPCDTDNAASDLAGRCGTEASTMVDLNHHDLRIWQVGHDQRLHLCHRHSRLVPEVSTLLDNLGSKLERLSGDS